MFSPITTKYFICGDGADRKNDRVFTEDRFAQVIAARF